MRPPKRGRKEVSPLSLRSCTLEVEFHEVAQHCLFFVLFAHGRIHVVGGGKRGRGLKLDSSVIRSPFLPFAPLDDTTEGAAEGVFTSERGDHEEPPSSPSSETKNRSGIILSLHHLPTRQRRRDTPPEKQNNTNLAVVAPEDEKGIPMDLHHEAAPSRGDVLPLRLLVIFDGTKNALHHLFTEKPGLVYHAQTRVRVVLSKKPVQVTYSPCCQPTF